MTEIFFTRDFNDIRVRERFKEPNIFGVEDFLKILGQYKLPEKHEKQACQRKGCKTPHRNGWVVQLKDGSESNVGVICGGKYFGANENYSAQVKLAKRQIERRELINSLAANLEFISANESEIRQLGTALEEMRQRVKNFSDALPKVVRRELQDRSIATRALVEVEVEYKEIDEEGRVIISWVKSRAGIIQGIEVFNFRSLSSLALELEKVRDLIYLGDVEMLKIQELKNYSSVASRANRSISDSRRLIEFGKGFFRFENILLLSLLSRNHHDRSVSGALALAVKDEDTVFGQLDISNGKSVIFSEFDQSLRSTLGRNFRPL